MLKYALIIGLTLILYYLFSPGKVWLILNKSGAEEYAEELLEKTDVPKTPEQFIDYVVSVKDGYVLFSSHKDTTIIYGYFPHNDDVILRDIDERIQWSKIDNNWYIGKVSHEHHEKGS